MLYRPVSREWSDPWVVYEQSAYWLYYIEREGGVGVALRACRSDDGIHWSELGRVLERGEGARDLSGGSVWRAPTYERDGRLLLAFTEQRGSVPTRMTPAVHLAESTDLTRWRRLGPEYTFRPDRHWYRAEGVDARWHDFCTLPRGAGGRYGYWSADPLEEEPGIGFGTSLDCCHWRALPPPRVDWAGLAAPPSLRVAGAAHAAGRYLAFVEGGRRSRQERCVYLLTAQEPGGPFAPAPRNAQVLATSAPGNAGLGLRTVEFGGDVLVSHVATTCRGEAWLAPLKGLRVGDDGSAWLTYWPGNDALCGERLAVALEPAMQSPEGMRAALLDRRLEADGGILLEGRWTGLPTQVSDAFLGGGLYVETEEGSGEGILVPMVGQALAGPMRAGGATLRLEDAVDRELPYRETAAFRLLLRGELVELYLDDVLMCSIGLPGPATGRLGLVTAGRTAAEEVRAYGLAL